MFYREDIAHARPFIDTAEQKWVTGTPSSGLCLFKGGNQVEGTVGSTAGDQGRMSRAAETRCGAGHGETDMGGSERPLRMVDYCNGK